MHDVQCVQYLCAMLPVETKAGIMTEAALSQDSPGNGI